MRMLPKPKLIIVTVYGSDAARLHVRIVEELGDVVDRTRRDPLLLEERDVLRQRPLLDEAADDRVDFVAPLDALPVRLETLIRVEIGAPDGREEPLRHRLRRRRDRDPAAVLRRVDVARRRRLRRAPHALADPAREAVDR